MNVRAAKVYNKYSMSFSPDFLPRLFLRPFSKVQKDVEKEAVMQPIMQWTRNLPASLEIKCQSHLLTQQDVCSLPFVHKATFPLEKSNPFNYEIEIPFPTFCYNFLERFYHQESYSCHEKVERDKKFHGFMWMKHRTRSTTTSSNYRY